MGNFPQSNVEFAEHFQLFIAFQGGEMKISKTKTLAMGLALLLGVLWSASIAEKVWQDCGGYVIMEAEDTESSLGQWVVKTSPENYTGTGALEFMGNSPSGGSLNSPLTYNFEIETAGIYHLALHAYKRLEGAAGDLCNDGFVKLAGDFTSGSSSVTTAALKSDCKLYIHGESHLHWDWGIHLDCSGADHTPAIYNLTAGSYVFTLSGRSQRYNVDRIVYHMADKESIARNTATPQTLTCGTSILNGTASSVRPGFTVVSNPLSARVSIQCPGQAAGELIIYSVEGKAVRSFTTQGESIVWSKEDANGNRVKPGVYIGVFSSGMQNISSSFVVF